MSNPHQPDAIWRGIVELLAAHGVVQSDIGRVLGISDATLRKYYRRELDAGYVKANVRVAANLFRIAISNDPGSTTAAIFWLKARAAWRY